LTQRLLAVEDTPALRALLQLCLTRAGYAVDLAEDGLTALELFRAGTYDAVIMDVQMPTMDGLTAVARMREREKEINSPPVPILALTANTEPSDLKRCLDAGFSATVKKPFGREELLAVVARALGGEAGAVPIFVTADPEFADLISPFLDNCRRDAEMMTQALARRDYPPIVAASHRITGAGACFGFQPLSDESRRIESAAKVSDDAAIMKHLDEMRLYLKRVSVVYP
jgi:CheY-like chemotaxis protein/HPt (histidine-containing phosphotransfer) domain-containing protein